MLPVSPEELQAAAAFFCGEGCISIVEVQRYTKYGKPNPKLMYVSLSLVQRSDNHDTVQWLKDKFGGCVTAGEVHQVLSTGRKHWRRAWQLTSHTPIRLLLEAVINCPIPHNKRDTARIALEFLTCATTGRGIKYTDEQRALRAEVLARFKKHKVEIVDQAQYKFGPHGNSL